MLYQVTITQITNPRPVFRTVEAESASEAKRKVKAEWEQEGIRFKKMSARKVW